MSNEIPVQELCELLDSISDKIPKLLTGVMDTLYSAEAGTKMGKAIGNLYKEMVNSGIPQEDALKIAKDYMLSLKDVAGNVASNNQIKNK